MNLDQEIVGTIYLHSFYYCLLLENNSNWLEISAVSSTGSDHDDQELFFGLLVGTDNNSRALSGVVDAISYINGRDDLFPGYDLRLMHIFNGECNRPEVLDRLYRCICQSSHQMVALIESGCPTAAQAIAEASNYYNISQISCASSSDVLSDHVRFPYYFQLLPSEVNLARVFYSIIKEYGWRRVALIVQNEHRYKATVQFLKLLLSSNSSLNISIVESVHDADDIGSSSLETILNFQARIIVTAMDSKYAKQLTCLAYKLGIKYPKYLFLTYGSYEPWWWSSEEVSDECSPEEIAEVLQFSLAALYFPSLSTHTTDAGIDFRVNSSNCMDIDFYHLCYDATMVLALALNEIIQELSAMNRTSEVTKFNYNSNDIPLLISQYLHHMNFTGKSGTIHFDKNGIREPSRLRVLQYRTTYLNGSLIAREVDGNIHSATLDQRLRLIDVAYVRDDTASLEFLIDSKNGIWPSYVPYDGVTELELVTVNWIVTATLVLLNLGGLIFGLVCLTFNVIFRKRKLIRLSSPNLNYLLIIGMLLMYMSGIAFVIPMDLPPVVSTICLIRAWFLTIGYSCGFGTIIAKLWRVYFIFRNPQVARKKHGVKDWHLIVFVMILVLVNAVILCLQILLEGLVAHFSITTSLNKEMPFRLHGELKIQKAIYFYQCSSHIWIRYLILAMIFASFSLLQVCALYLAFQTRKVKVKGLNDAKYTTIIVYITTIVMFLTVVITFTLSNYVNAYVTVYGGGIWITATVILGIIFIPKMLGLCMDPDGKGVFSAHKEAMQISTVLRGSQIGETENDQLKRRIKQLENLLAKYKKIAEVDMRNESITSVDMTFTQEKNEAVVQRMVKVGFEPHTKM